MILGNVSIAMDSFSLKSQEQQYSSSDYIMQATFTYNILLNVLLNSPKIVAGRDLETCFVDYVGENHTT